MPPISGGIELNRIHTAAIHMVDLTNQLMDVTKKHNDLAQLIGKQHRVNNRVESFETGDFDCNEFLFSSMMLGRRFDSLKQTSLDLIENERRIAELWDRWNGMPKGDDGRLYMAAFSVFEQQRELYFVRMGSVLDLLARELLFFYFPVVHSSIPKDWKHQGCTGNSALDYRITYKWFAREVGSRADASELKNSVIPDLLRRSVDSESDGWANHLLHYRNYIIHYIIHSGLFENIDVIVEGRKWHKVLPSDPQVRPDRYSYDTGIPTNHYCYTRMGTLAGLMDGILTSVLSEYS